VNRVLLRATAIAARYFAHGDTRVFQTIRFDFRNPIPADRAVLAFIRHLEAQPLAAWRDVDAAPRGPVARLRVAGADEGRSGD